MNLILKMSEQIVRNKGDEQRLLLHSEKNLLKPLIPNEYSPSEHPMSFPRAQDT